MYVQASFRWWHLVKFTSMPAVPRFPPLPSTWKATTHSTGSRTKRKCLTYQSHDSTWCAHHSVTQWCARYVAFYVFLLYPRKMNIQSTNVCTFVILNPSFCVFPSHLELSQWGVCSVWWWQFIGHRWLRGGRNAWHEHGWPRRALPSACLMHFFMPTGQHPPTDTDA